jgi:hypothetical protein
MLIDLDYETIAAARKSREWWSTFLWHKIVAAVAEAADNTTVYDNSGGFYAIATTDYLYSNDSGTVRIPAASSSIGPVYRWPGNTTIIGRQPCDDDSCPCGGVKHWHGDPS